ncbi:receptor expression-enhancing protein 1/2/3/4 [Spatholobus suberectus]|nr:receptor expression-enhancing protein 1/2/3/4 [Spatholobus suberectus]
MESKSGSSKRKSGGKGEIVDGSKIMELVGNEQVFSNFVDNKFHELDKDRDGKLSMKELEPAVADIGAGLGLPAQGTSPDSDHIYFEVLNEFTHGKQEKVSKTEFKEVLSDILLGMAAGLKRDPIVILRMDGEDLLEFVNGPSYEAEMASIFSQIQSPSGSLREHVIEGFGRLTVDQGIPPTSDSWVFNNIVDPALSQAGPALDKPVAQETFLEEFKKVALSVVDCLKEKPVIVAHSENTFDGRGVNRLLSNKFELDRVYFYCDSLQYLSCYEFTLFRHPYMKFTSLSLMQTLNLALENLPKDRNGKISKDYLRVALDLVSLSAGLPPVGAIEEMDKVINEAFKMVNADDTKTVKEDEFKKILTEILGSIMLQLEGNPISVSSNSVVHEPLGSSSTLLQPSSSETA